MFSMESIIELIISCTAALIALSVHEFSHAYAAYRMGDPTASNLGRLSINPLKHLDPLGTLCMIFFHFGWAKPVPINARNFKDPKKGFAISALAGPLSNIILGFISAFLVLLCSNFFVLTDNTFLNNLMYYTLNFVIVFHYINVGLGIFNLLPIPPFDGSRLITVILPPRIYFKIMKYEKYVYWGVIAWLLLGAKVYELFLSIPFIARNSFLSSFVRIFSLSDLISDAIYFISELMLKFWALLPFLSF